MKAPEAASPTARTSLPPSLASALWKQERARRLKAGAWLLLVPLLAIGGWTFWTSSRRISEQVRLIADLRARGFQIESIDGGSVWWGKGPLWVSTPEFRFHQFTVTDSDLVRVGKLGRTEVLDLSNAPQITDAGLAPLANLAGLRDLYLGRLPLAPGFFSGQGSTRLTAAALDSVVRQPRLRYLSLEGMPITDADLARLDALPDLETIVLAGTKVSKAGIQTLQQARPTLAIDHDLDDPADDPGMTADEP